MGEINTGTPGLLLKGNSFLIDKVVYGVRIYESLGPVKQDTAIKILSKRVNAVLEGKYLPEKSLRSLTVLDILNYYWGEHLQYKEYANDVRCILNAVAEKLGDILVINLCRADMERYKRERLRDKKRNRCKGTVSRRTVQKDLQHLSMALNFAADNNKIKHNPIRRFIKVPQGQPKKIVLDDGFEDGPEWLAIYESIADADKPIVLTLYETGMRPKEVFNMRWSWIIQKAEGMWIIKIPADIDKTDYEHELPVSLKLLAMFKEMGIRSDDTLVFPSPVTSGVRTTIKTAFKNALIMAKLRGKGITPYALRRTRTTIWDEIDSNASRYAVGHVPKEVHQKNYVKISIQRLFRLVSLDYKVKLRAISKIA